VPYYAIAQQNEEEYVLVLNEGCVTKQEIKTRRELSETVEVISGLRGNEKLILNPEEFQKAKKVIIK